MKRHLNYFIKELKRNIIDRACHDQSNEQKIACIYGKILLLILSSD